MPDLPRVIWAADLLKEPEPDHNWKVPGLLEAGDRVIVTGNEGEGKSTYLRQTAVQTASGIHPVTYQPMPPIRTLLIDLENSREQIKTELDKICQNAGIPCPGEPNLLVGNFDAGLDLLGSDWAEIDKVLHDFKPDLVIGGPMYKMLEASLAEEESSSRLRAVLDRWRSELGFALMLEAHQVQETIAWDSSEKKFKPFRPQRPFGSSLWRRWPEFGICIFNDGTIAHWRGQRQVREWPRRLWRNGKPWLWSVVPGVCQRCGDTLEGSQEFYCSERCSNAARQSRFRTKQLNLEDDA